MYNRLFTKILDSSIWLEPSNTRIVWVTLLAAMDEDGYAHFSAIENLAARARVNVKETQKAIDCFTSPDPSSANPDNDGRRVERVPGGFLILNANHHRQTLNREIRREQTRIRVARHREKLNGNTSGVTEALRSVSVTLPASASESTVASEKKREPLEFLVAIKAMDCYRTINIDREIGKMEAWLLTPKGKGRKLTKSFIVNWLNKIDVPIGREKPAKLDPAKIEVPSEFKTWAVEVYPKEADKIATWKTWDQVPEVCRLEWKREKIDPLVEQAGG